MSAIAVVNEIRDNGVEQFGRYYAQYLAYAQNVVDPDNRGRITVICKEVFGNNESPFCECNSPFAGFNNSGIVCMPKQGDVVYISFFRGDINFPFWTGGVWGNNELPSKVDNVTIFTKGGGRVDVGDKGVVITSQGATINIDNNGTVSIDAKQISLGENADQFAVKGNELVQFLTKFVSSLPTYTVGGVPLVPPPTVVDTLAKLPNLLSKVISIK